MPVDRDGQPGTAKVAVEDGSVNVYADLGRPDADEMLVKAELASRIGEVIKRRRLTQVAAARITGLPQPKLSGLLRGQFRSVSEAKMLACLTRLGRDVRIVVGPARRRAGAGRIEVLSGWGRMRIRVKLITGPSGPVSHSCPRRFTLLDARAVPLSN